MASVRHPGSKRALRPCDRLLKEYESHIRNAAALARRACEVSERLDLIVDSLGSLLADDDFVAILREERLDSVPLALEDRISRRKALDETGR